MQFVDVKTDIAFKNAGSLTMIPKSAESTSGLNEAYTQAAVFYWS
jgi:hypothetical protein